MYPTLVVVLAATRRSVLERRSVPEHAPSTGIRFATNPGGRRNRGGHSSRCPTCNRTEIGLETSFGVRSHLSTTSDTDQELGRIPDQRDDKGLEKSGRDTTPSLSTSNQPLSGGAATVMGTAHP